MIRRRWVPSESQPSCEIACLTRPFLFLCPSIDASCVARLSSRACWQRLRCDPPFLHEGMTTSVSCEETNKPIGPRLQLVTDPDWFNAEAARAMLTKG